MPNYSMDGLDERAREAREAHQDYIVGTMSKYEARCAWRKERKILAIAVLGMGRAGKDTAAEFLCGHTEMVYPQSSSWMALPMIAHMIGISPEKAYEERHQNRKFWINACHALRGREYDFFAKLCLSAGDIAVGLRGRLELDQVVRKSVVDLTIWIDNPRVPADETVEFGADDCDIVIPNHGSRLDLYARLHKLLRLLHCGAFTTIY